MSESAIGETAASAGPSTAQQAAPLPIVRIGHPVLRERAAEVSQAEIATPAFQHFIDTMIATFHAAQGVGLAAPQIGVSKRVIVLEETADGVERLADDDRRERERIPFPLTVIINPVLRAIGEERRTFFEGCLSIPLYIALVERAREVEVTGLDRNGKPLAWRIAGWPARILQHEVDHLDGVLYVDKMVAKSFVAADEAQARFAGKPIAQVRRLLGA